MSSYDNTLPNCFPHVIEIPASDVQLCIDIILKDNEDFVAGSSFAVTSDIHNSNQNRRLWLSYHSAVRLWKAGIITLPERWKETVTTWV